MMVMKFGGTSLGTPQRIEQVSDIISRTYRTQAKLAVVVSAFGGVTNQLIDAAHRAASGDTRYEAELAQLESRHLDAIQYLLPAPGQTDARTFFMTELKNLFDVLHGVFLVRELSPRVLDFVMSFGERFSAYIVAEALRHRDIPAYYLDARQVVRTDARYGAARVEYDVTYKAIQNIVHPRNGLPVITGFIASTANNQTTTLGRSGSDFTASIFGAALDATEIQIWTDVDGVLTADPRVVPQAFTIPELSYEEAMEMSHFGAKVIHPRTMQPAMERNIPIRIRNTFRPEQPGTLIRRTPAPSPFPIKGISSIEHIALVNVSGSGMVGATGIAGKIFTALAQHDINIILISQASSEHSICLGILPGHASRAQEVLKKALKLELLEKTVGAIEVEENRSVVAVVGENMRRTAGIAGQIFSALGQAAINIVAIAQGSSELNISFVVERTDLPNALRVIHHAFFNGKGGEVAHG